MSGIELPFKSLPEMLKEAHEAEQRAAERIKQIEADITAEAERPANVEDLGRKLAGLEIRLKKVESLSGWLHRVSDDLKALKAVAVSRMGSAAETQQNPSDQGSQTGALTPVQKKSGRCNHPKDNIAFDANGSGEGMCHACTPPARVVPLISTNGRHYYGRKYKRETGKRLNYSNEVKP